MSQHDYIISNDTGANVRSDLNNALGAIATVNSGATEPSTTYAYQLWMDTANNVLKMRNSANSAWYTLPISPIANNTVDINGGTIDGATIGGSSAGAGTFSNLTSTGTTALQNVSTTNSALNISSSASDGSATIDASGNLLVGKTSSSVSTVGAELNASGNIRGTVSGGVCAYFNRTTSDGDIAVFRKDNATVGSIGSTSGELFIDGNALTGKCGIQFGGSAWYPRDTGALADNAVDLGWSGGRFKNLYLSGGVYLGGTGAANYLDDYETGVYAPTGAPETSGSFEFGNGSAYAAYEKIGDIVHVHGYLIPVNISSPVGSYYTISLPFTCVNGMTQDAEVSAVNSWYIDLSAGTKTLYPTGIFSGGSAILVYMNASLLTYNDRIVFSGTYRAA